MTEHIVLPLKDRHELRYDLTRHEDTARPVVSNASGINGYTGSVTRVPDCEAELQQMHFLRDVVLGATERSMFAEDQISGYSPAVLKYGAAREYQIVQNAMNEMNERFAAEAQMIEDVTKFRVFNAIEGRERLSFASSNEDQPNHGVTNDQRSDRGPRQA